MTTQDLETNGFRNSVGNILRDKLDAERQRDELLAVLKDLRDNVKDDSPDMWGRVEAAIAKAEAS